MVTANKRNLNYGYTATALQGIETVVSPFQ